MSLPYRSECKCMCHSRPGMMHIQACCQPDPPMTDHSPDHAERAAIVDRLRQRLAEASAQPWVYRPDKHDDWGWIRGVERDDRDIGPFRPIVANAKDSLVRDEDMDAHRRAGTDPFGPNALLIVEAVNALPWLLDLAAASLHDDTVRGEGENG